MPALISPPGSRYKWRTRWARRLKEPTLQPWYQATDLLFVSAKASYDCYRHLDPDKNTDKNADKKTGKKSKRPCSLDLLSDDRPFSRVRTEYGFETEDWTSTKTCQHSTWTHRKRRILFCLGFRGIRGSGLHRRLTEQAQTDSIRTVCRTSTHSPRRKRRLERCFRKIL